MTGGLDFWFLSAHMAGAVASDLRRRRIPNGLVASLAAGGICRGTLNGQEALRQGLLGCLIAFFLLTLLSLLGKGAIGGGDIKLMAAAGLFLGPAKVMNALIWTFVAGGVMCLIMLGLRLARLKERIPYAPAIAVGVLIAAATR